MSFKDGAASALSSFYEEGINEVPWCIGVECALVLFNVFSEAGKETIKECLPLGQTTVFGEQFCHSGKILQQEPIVLEDTIDTIAPSSEQFGPPSKKCFILFGEARCISVMDAGSIP